MNKLSNIAEIDKHLELIEAVLTKYSYEEGQLKALLEKTKKKQQDKLLNMSIIGEFSSGKSSFINALLRNELLLSCSLQGTTVANTVIEYSPDCAVELTDKERKVKKINFSSIEQMAEKIESFTTDPDFAKTVHSVKIYLPAKNIKDKIRIIDTPGTNATELWHEDVAKNAIRGLSDASVILIDSTKPFPETICNFVLKNLDKMLPQCAFVLTKFDMIEPEEREMVLKYAKTKVKSIFGMENALILPYSSVSILEKADEEDEMYNLSVRSEEQLLDFIVKQRTVAQIKKIITFIDLMYDSTATYVQNVSAKYGTELSLLLKTNKTNFPTFIAYQRKQRAKDFEVKAKEQFDMVINMIYKKNFDACEKIKTIIDSKNSVNDLNNYISNNLLNVSRAYADDIIEYANRGIYTIVKYMTEQLKSFFMAFSNTFSEVGNLEVKNSDLEDMMSVPRKLRIDYSEKIEEGKKIIYELQSSFFNTNMLMSGSVNNVEQYKKNVGLVLTRYEKSLFNRISYDVKVQYEKLISQFSEKIVTEIENFNSEYSQIIEERIQNKKRYIKTQINSINRDLVELNSRKHTLSLIETQLDTIY